MKNNGTLTFRTFQRINSERAKEAFSVCDDWTDGDWGNALAGETGELCNLLKKLRRGEKIPKQELADEVADVVTYAALIASNLGIDLESAVIEKFNLVSERRDCRIKL